MVLDMQGARYKVHDVLDQDKAEYDADVAAIWDSAEKFDPKTERLFRYLQVRAPRSLCQPAGLDIVCACGPDASPS